MNLYKFLFIWTFSTIHKDIDILYLMSRHFVGVLGTITSMLIRIELAQSGSQILNGNDQLYNVLVMVHTCFIAFLNNINYARR